MTPDPAYTDQRTTLFTGDARSVLAELPDESVDCFVTSPPYYRLRDYQVDGQYGQEPTLTDYLEHLRDTFTEARRVLTPSGTLWLNVGDSYANAPTPRASGVGCRRPGTDAQDDLPRKSLLGVPWRLALLLQEDGWILRNAIIWYKPNGMPQSCRDRLANRYEHVFLLVKSRHYHFSLDAIRVPHAPSSHARSGRARTDQPRRPHARHWLAHSQQGVGRPHRLRPEQSCHPAGANPGDVWAISTRPSRVPHYATFPIDLPLRAIAAGCPAGGTVCDPFSGAGTTGLAAHQLGRSYLGIELNRNYQRTAIDRLSTTTQTNRA